MDAFLIVIAILSAVALLFRCAIPPRKHKFTVGEQLSESAMLFRVEMLGKRCKSVRRGFGVYYRDVKLRKLINVLQKKAIAENLSEEWEKEILSARSEILDAFKKGQSAMRMSYTIGAVDGFPRLYLFCETIVRHTNGNIRAKMLDRAIDAFCKYAEFSDKELTMLTNMLRFCLCRLLYYTAVLAQEKGQLYDVGTNDGQNNKVDLDSLHYCDYICGLYAATPLKDRQAVARIFETNNADFEIAETARLLFLAKTSSVIVSAIKSLKMLCDYCPHGVHTTEFQVQKGVPVIVKRICVIIPTALILLCAILVCIFVPARYSAIISVVSVLLYALFRIPILLYAPDSTSIIGSRLEKLGNNIFKNKENDNMHVLDRINSEIAYFGGETELIENVLNGKETVVNTDNRGNISVSRSNGKKYSLKFFYICDGCVLGLDEFDGVFEKHASIYNIVTDKSEVKVKIIPMTDGCGCCCSINTVNRTSAIKRARIAVIVVPKEQSLCYAMETIRNGIAFVDEESVNALACNGFVRYGNNIDSISELVGKYNSKCKISPLVAEIGIELPAFGAKQECVAIVFGSCVREVERYIENVLDEGYMENAETAAEIFCVNNIVNAVDTRMRCADGGVECLSDNIYSSPDPYDSFDISNGGDIFTSDGCYIFDPKAEHIKYANNTVAYERSGLVLSPIGVEEFIFDCKTVSARRDAFDVLPSAFVIIGENTVIWSPTSAPLGKGNLCVKHAMGFTEYICGYNGCMCTLKCYISLTNIAVFDLTIDNRVEKQRNLDIMFSALFSEAFTASEQFDMPSAMRGGDRYTVLCSEKISSKAGYKESYYVRGRIERAAELRIGGTSVAPTVSVRLSVSECGKARIVFALAESDHADNDIDIDLSDEWQHAIEAKSRMFGKINLRSANAEFNYAHKRALYDAYTNGFLLNRCRRKDLTAICSAVKYLDVNGVKNCLRKLLSEQAESAYDSETDFLLNTACAVIDYVEFSHDYGFLDERVQMKVGRNCRNIKTCGSVADRCLYAAVKAINRQLSFDNLVSSMMTDRQIIDILRYFRSGNAKYSRELAEAFNKIVCRYAQNLNSLKYYVCRHADIYEQLVYSFLLFRAGEYGSAWGAVKKFTRIVIENEEKTDPMIDALYYVLITQQLLGISFSGEKISICPRLACVVPEIEFDIITMDGAAHIIVDNSRKDGEWMMRADNISYRSNNIRLNKKEEKTIIFCRNGQ